MKNLDKETLDYILMILENKILETEIENRMLKNNINIKSINRIINKNEYIKKIINNSEYIKWLQYFQQLIILEKNN